MGFALWIDGDLAWAQGLHEYRPMGAAVIGVRGLFAARDFRSGRVSPARTAPNFAGYFASIEAMNRFLTARRNRRSQTGRKKLRRSQPAALPYL
jgi:hypothetical protein